MKRVPVDSIRVGSRVRKDVGDLDALVESIRTVGLLNPVTISATDELLAGSRRLEAVKRLGWTEVPVTVAIDVADLRLAFIAERDENTCRKDFTPSEAVEMARRIEAAEKPKATERHRNGSAAGGRGGQGAGNLPEPSEPIRAREVAAEAVGMSRRTLDKANTVVQATDHEDPAVREVAAAAVEQMDESGKVDGAYEAVRRAKAAAGDRPPRGVVTVDKSREATAERWQQIERMASEGYTSHQIADHFGMSAETLRDSGKKRGVHFPADAAIGRVHRPKANRVVGETVAQVEAAAFGIGVVPIDFDALDRELIDGWVSSLTESLRSLNNLKNRLKELTRVEA